MPSKEKMMEELIKEFTEDVQKDTRSFMALMAMDADILTDALSSLVAKALTTKVDKDE